jgi:hypothetical protein
LFDATSHRCAMPIARSAPAAVSPTEMAKDKRSILNSCHRDIGPTRLPAPDPNFGVTRLHGDAVSLTRQTPRRGMPQIVSAARPAFTIDDPSCSSVRPFPRAGVFLGAARDCIARAGPTGRQQGIDRLTWRLASHTGGIYAMRVLRGGATCRQEARDRAIHVLAFRGMLHARSVGSI